MNYKINKPYPKIEVEKKNTYYGGLLLDSYAGIISEDTAVHLYFYQAISKENENHQFYDTLEGIARVEMHHLELLGKTIKLLGLNPIFANSNNTPWTARYVNYVTDIKSMLEVDIHAETQAINHYYNLIKIIDDKHIKALLSRIIEDEELHLRIFKDMYSQIKK